MAKWYKNSYRRNLIDMHIEDWNEEFLSQFNSVKYVELLKKAKVQSAMIYINSHVGYCYWPTKTGEMHSAFKGEDKIGEVIDLCHKEGMDVIVYYSLIYNNWAYENHPEWRMKDVNGAYSCDNGSRYGLCCPNNMEYRDFVFAQIEEFCSIYEFEGVFFDMTFYPLVCYCDSCRERYLKETGSEMPAVIDWDNPEWVAFQERREAWLAEFAEITTAKLKELKPEATVEHQFSSACHPWIRAVTDNVSSVSDYVGGDLYGGFLQQSFICKLYRGLSKNQPFEYMTSRCNPDLTDHTTLKTKEMIQLHDYIALAHQGAFLIIDAIDPRGTINEKVYELIGEVFEESSRYEPFMGGDLCYDAAVYFSLKSKFDPADNGKLPTETSMRMPHVEAAFGASRFLKENHIPYTVITRKDLAQLPRNKILILSDVLNMSAEEEEAVVNFVREGGSLYMSGRTSPRLASELLGVSFEGETIENITYLAPTDRGAFLLPDVSYDYPLTVFSPQQKMNGADEKTVMATTVLPYTVPGAPGKFASIHSNPPGIHTEYPAIVYDTFGKGRVVWVAAPIELAKHDIHSRIFANLMNLLKTDDFHFTANAPKEVEVTLFHQPENNCYIVNVVNVQENTPVIPILNIEIKILTGDKMPVEVVSLPDKRKAEYSIGENHVVIKIDMLHIFQMFSLIYK
ncbi:MAG TPA: family 10 glycosylhydrolase [Clostridiales bacterium]|nr:family 10 glycosylhydrolase [Clostridiales bacterium]